MTYSNYSNLGYHSRPGKESQPKNYLGRLLIVILVVAIGLIGFKVKQADHAAALAEQTHIQAQQMAFAASVKASFSGSPSISYSVSVIDPNSNAHQTLGDNNVIQAASVGKLLTAALYLHKVELGQASLSKNIDGAAAKHELKALINQSDDTAWLSLNDWLGHASLNSYARQLGLNSYDADSDTISTTDVSKLLDKLYEHDLLNDTNTNLLLSWMQNTNYEDFISLAIPRGYSIYHKVGLIDDDVNDAAIITKADKALILVIFTDGHGVQNWDQRSVAMQAVTRAAIKNYLN